MRILLLGKTGQLGLDLQKTLKSLGELISLDSSQLNLEQTSQIGETVRAIKPDVIVNAAAYTKVDRAEIEPDMAYIVNAQAPKVLAEEAKLLGALLILFSTDYVFDGAKKGAYSETDFVSPKNIYGATKLRGENYILQVDGLHLILRTSWVYSLFGNNFMTKVLDWAKKEDILRIAQDQFGSPTWTVWLAQITAYVVQCYQHLGLEWMMTQKGLYHVASEGIVSRFEWGRQILDLNHLDSIEITPAVMKDFPARAKRPTNSALNSELFGDKFKVNIPNWSAMLTAAISNDESQFDASRNHSLLRAAKSQEPFEFT